MQIHLFKLNLQINLKNKETKFQKPKNFHTDHDQLADVLLLKHQPVQLTAQLAADELFHNVLPVLDFMNKKNRIFLLIPKSRTNLISKINTKNSTLFQAPAWPHGAPSAAPSTT